MDPDCLALPGQSTPHLDLGLLLDQLAWLGLLTCYFWHLLGTATCEGLAVDIEDCCLPYFAVQTAQCDRCNDAKTTDGK